MERNIEKIINRYLREIDNSLEDVSYTARKEFFAEIRSHLVEKWENCEVQNEESLLQVINEFGDPREIADDFLDRSFSGARHSGLSYPPSWLVIVLTIFLWPAGIILAWLSPAWRVRDKIIATMIPLLITVLLLGFSMAARVSFVESVTDHYITEVLE